jgi:integrase
LLAELGRDELRASAAFHDFDEFERLVQAAEKRDHDAYLVVLLGGEAGLRRGEIAALEWGDIDLKKRQLRVRRSVWKGQTSTPKGGRLRYAPLTERLTTALHAAGRFPGPLLSCDREGKAVSEKVIADHVEHAARAANLTRRGVHVLRHHADSRIMPRVCPAEAVCSGPGDASSLVRSA